MKKSSNSIKKRLLISALVPLAILGINSNSVNAEDIYAPVPTLTKLHDAGETIPNTDPPVVYPESAYTITTGENTYNIDVKELGTGNTNIYYYKWTTNGNGNRELTNGTAEDYDFTAKCDSTNLSEASKSFGNIEGDFINNWAGLYGGAIYNLDTINFISGDFINNTVYSMSQTYGGAIMNSSGTINGIIGNFISNRAISSNNVARGGAITNLNASINSITGDFINNFVHSTATGASGTYGGAIFNESASSINSISGDFINNYAFAATNAAGGAIFNSTNSTINSITGNFIGNYAKTTSNTYKAYGGAIYNGEMAMTNSYGPNPTYNANAKLTLSGNTFMDNYVDNNGTVIPNSIYNAGIINVADGATVTIKDGYDGLAEAKLNVGTGSILNLNVDNNYIQNDNLGIITNNGTINWNLDVNLSGTCSADNILANNSQENISNIILNDINIINGDSAAQDDYIIRILKTNNNYLQLALSEELAGKTIVIKNTATPNVEDDVTKDVKWDDQFEKYTLNTSVVGNVTLDTTTTTNDSIKLTATGTQTTKTDNVSLGDTLALVNQLDTAEDRSFTFDTANDKYNATSDLGTTSAGQLSINGVSATTEGVTNRSEINLNGHSGFELDNATTLNINNTRFTGNDTLITVNNQNAVVNLQNADLNGSIVSENGYTLNINGDTSDRTIINGTVGVADVNHNGGSLEFNSDTFSDAEFTTLSGTVDLVTGQIENYDLGKLTSDESTNWTFDIDSSGNGADTLTVGAGSSGTVTVSGINFINGDSPSSEFTVQLLNAGDDNIQLALNPELTGENYVIGVITRATSDEVTPTAKWNQIFNTYTQTGTNYGSIDLATTNTTNDSLQLQITNTEWDEAVVSGSMGDTLALVNQLETTEDRNFNFDTASDVYEVTYDLGTTSEGTMNVNGVATPSTSQMSVPLQEGDISRSTINGNNYNMFVLSNPTTLNLNNVKIQGANSVASGTNQSAVINMNNVELKNNASGITTAGSVNISGNSLFENNGNGIEVTSEDSIITLNGIDGDGYNVVFKDKLKGVSGAKLNLKAGQVDFHQSVTDLDINMDSTTANLKADNVFNGQDLTVASASNISMINNSVGTMQLNSLTLNDNMNLGVDVDLANKSMDRISADTYDLGDNKINVNRMNLLSDATEVRTDIEFADEQLRNNVTTSVSEVAYSPIYKYGVNYNSENGEFQFTRSNSGGGGDTPSYNDLNPSVMAAPVAAQLGGYASMLDNYGNAFNHMDMYMLKPANLRAAELNANKYAIADGSPARYYSNETNTNGIWVRPYTSYDSVGLKHGPKVHNVSYGSFIGGDFGMHDFGNGLYGSFSPYISYQGAHQKYSGNSVYQNGGTFGFTGTLYKGNFFTGLTAGIGANITEANTMYGNEDFPMLTSGVASKTGYNIEFKDGKFIIQPSLTLSYTFVNAFDYKNAAGVRIDTAPLHAVNINPNLRFSFNTKNYWQPYAFVGMNWNIMNNDGHYLANATTLPEFSMKPYVQYGLGIQKLFSDNFTAFAQIAIRNGGRNGVGGTLGMKWIFGGQPKSQPIQPQNVL